MCAEWSTGRTDALENLQSVRQFTLRLTVKNTPNNAVTMNLLFIDKPNQTKSTVRSNGQFGIDGSWQSSTRNFDTQIALLWTRYDCACTVTSHWSCATAQRGFPKSINAYIYNLTSPQLCLDKTIPNMILLSFSSSQASTQTSRLRWRCAVIVHMQEPDKVFWRLLKYNFTGKGYISLQHNGFWCGIQREQPWSAGSATYFLCASDTTLWLNKQKLRIKGQLIECTLQCAFFISGTQTTAARMHLRNGSFGFGCGRYGEKLYTN